MAHISHSRTTRRGAVSGPLVVGQIALSLVLVVAAGLFGRTFSTLASRDIGFRPEGLHGAFVEARRLTPERRTRLYGELQEAAARVPGRAGGRRLADWPAQRHGLEHRRGSRGRAAQAGP